MLSHRKTRTAGDKDSLTFREVLLAVQNSGRLPPCGGGLGRGVASLTTRAPLPRDPHPQPLPTRGVDTAYEACLCVDDGEWSELQASAMPSGLERRDQAILTALLGRLRRGAGSRLRARRRVLRRACADHARHRRGHLQEGRHRGGRPRRRRRITIETVANMSDQFGSAYGATRARLSAGPASKNRSSAFRRWSECDHDLAGQRDLAARIERQDHGFAPVYTTDQIFGLRQEDRHRFCEHQGRVGPSSDLGQPLPCSQKIQFPHGSGGGAASHLQELMRLELESMRSLGLWAEPDEQRHRGRDRIIAE